MAKNKKSTGLSLSTVFSLISMVLFIVKTVNSFSEGAKAGGASGIIKFAVLPLIIVFAICFFVQVIASIKDQKAVKESIGDAKYQIKTTKKSRVDYGSRRGTRERYRRDSSCVRRIRVGQY